MPAPAKAPNLARFSSKRRVLLAALAGGAALAGCGGPRRWGGEEPGSERADAELRQFAARGYDSAATSFAETWRERLLFRDDEIAVELLVPRQGPPVPLVLYLPGMGETAAAGERWRKAWSAAGYAVAVLQSVRAASLWASAASRRGDFAPQALEQFAPQALAERLAQVEFVLHDFARRGTVGPFAQLDLSRVAVAGFDLGAQTAMALAGEKHPNLARAPAVPGLRAVITLSPYVRISGGLFDRFSDIRIPVLAVTGTEDHDPYGLVDSPLTRRAPKPIQEARRSAPTAAAPRAKRDVAVRAALAVQAARVVRAAPEVWAAGAVWAAWVVGRVGRRKVDRAEVPARVKGAWVTHPSGTHSWSSGYRLPFSMPI
jgi:dienelactone hydrolase